MLSHHKDVVIHFLVGLDLFQVTLADRSEDHSRELCKCRVFVILAHCKVDIAATNDGVIKLAYQFKMFVFLLIWVLSNLFFGEALPNLQ